MSVNKINLKDDLKGKYIFLSASIPTKEKIEKYYLDTNPLDITDAIVALTKSILIRRGKLVFGGHPTISPLILSVAKNFVSYFKQDDLPLVYIYQSHFFNQEISRFTKELLNLGVGILKWSKAKKNRSESLKCMRKEMIKEVPLNAAIIIGGMEGVEEEYLLITKLSPNVPIYPIATAGGAAKKIFEEDFLNIEEWKLPWNYEIKNLKHYLYKSKEYSFLFKKISEDIITQPINILFFQEQRLDDYTNKIWRINDLIQKSKEFKIIYNDNSWKIKKKYSKKEIDKRELEIIKKADIVVRLIHSPVSSDMDSEGAQIELRKAIKLGKPIIEIFKSGIKELSKRSTQEENYLFRIPIHLKRGESLEIGIERGLVELSKIKEFKLSNLDKELTMT